MDNVKQTIDGLIESARISIDTALSLGREHNIAVDLNKLGITEDMSYVDESEYRQQYIEDNFGQYNVETGVYTVPELTDDELAEVEEHMAYLRERGGYDDSGYKHLGWMSSSTNC